MHQHEDPCGGGGMQIEKVSIRQLQGAESGAEKGGRGISVPFLHPSRISVWKSVKRVVNEFPQADSNWLGEVTVLLKYLR